MANKVKLDQAAGASVGKFFSGTEKQPEEHQDTVIDQKQNEEQKKSLTGNEQKALEAYRQGHTTPAMIEKAIGMNRGTAHTCLKNIKEKGYKLESITEVAQNTVHPQQKTQETKKQEQVNIPSQAEEKSENKPQEKTQKQTFSFRAEVPDIENWKLYAESKGSRKNDMGVLWTAAINEYIENHPLTGDQKKIFDLKAQAKDLQKGL